MHPHIGVAFVVFQANVILRPMALDQVHLEDQGLELRGHHNPLHVGDPSHQFGGLAIRRAGLVEIGADPAAQVHRLADVDHPAGLVFHQVTAGFGGDAFKQRLGHGQVILA